MDCQGCILFECVYNTSSCCLSVLLTLTAYGWSAYSNRFWILSESPNRLKTIIKAALLLSRFRSSIAARGADTTSWRPLFRGCGVAVLVLGSSSSNTSPDSDALFSELLWLLHSNTTFFVRTSFSSQSGAVFFAFSLPLLSSSVVVVAASCQRPPCSLAVPFSAVIQGRTCPPHSQWAPWHWHVQCQKVPRPFLKTLLRWLAESVSDVSGLSSNPSTDRIVVQAFWLNLGDVWWVLWPETKQGQLFQWYGLLLFGYPLSEHCVDARNDWKPASLTVIYNKQRIYILFKLVQIVFVSK